MQNCYLRQNEKVSKQEKRWAVKDTHFLYKNSFYKNIDTEIPPKRRIN